MDTVGIFDSDYRMLQKIKEIVDKFSTTLYLKSIFKLFNYIKIF